MQGRENWGGESEVGRTTEGRRGPYEVRERLSGVTVSKLKKRKMYEGRAQKSPDHVIMLNEFWVRVRR